jgi:hypothetical protein
LKRIKIDESFKAVIKIHEEHVKDKARIEKLIKDPKDMKLSADKKLLVYIEDGFETALFSESEKKKFLVIKNFGKFFRNYQNLI